MSAPKGWKAKAPTRCERLRALLADGRWHGHAEMVAAGGARFGARCLELRRGNDGKTPLIIEERHAADDDSIWEYRLAGFSDAKPEPRKRKAKRVHGACPTCGHSAEVSHG